MLAACQANPSDIEAVKKMSVAVGVTLSAEEAQTEGKVLMKVRIFTEFNYYLLSN